MVTASGEADLLLHDLDESQRRAVTSPARPLAILAPAGSGKTRVLTRRIAWRVATGDAEPTHVLALTFTRKAAGELRDRLRALGLRDGVAAGTFHGVAWAQLRGKWADERRTPPALLVRKGRLLGELCREAQLPASQLAAEIEWAKARLVGPDTYAEAAAGARRRTPDTAERVAELYHRYEDEKRRRRLVDFDDLLRLCSHLLASDDTFAATQRWRFRHLFVDEFQDVNPLQMQLLEAWRGDRWDLCAVGDPHQAIYGWNGADAGFLEGFRSRYPSADVIALDRNYRSTPQVLVAAAEVLTAARLRDRAVRATRPDGTPPRLTRHPTDRDEARAIARAVRDRRAPGTPWSAQAVLTRTHAQVPLVAEALRLVGVPHRVRGGDQLLSRPEMRSVTALLRGDAPGGAGRGRAAHRPLTTLLPDIQALADELGRGDDAEAAANLDLVVRCAQDHLRLDSLASAGGFLSWLVATLEAEGPEAGRDAVTLATFHAAKGLEWPVVHLAGLEDGLVPISQARAKAARAEEARLLYVAMTRAQDELSCTWSAQRELGGKPVERRLSPWLRSLAAAQRARPAPGPGPSDDWRVRLAEQRLELAAATGPPGPDGRRPGTGTGTGGKGHAGDRAGGGGKDEGREPGGEVAIVLPLPLPGALEPEPTPTERAAAALRAWREEAARAARVDPHVLVDDHLLDTIAERAPRSVDELAAIPGMGRLLAARIGPGLVAALVSAGAAPRAGRQDRRRRAPDRPSRTGKG